MGIGRELRTRGFRAVSKRRSFTVEDTVVITGTPRSGTTWVGAVLGSCRETAVLFEPLHLGQVPEAAAAGLEWRTAAFPGDEKPEFEEFFRAVMEGSVSNEWILRDVRLTDLASARRLVVKFVRANRLVGWMADALPVKPPLVVVRDPIATIASQHQAGWNHGGDPMTGGVDRDNPEWRRIVADLRDPLEIAAASWAIDFLAAAQTVADGRHNFVLYESLVADPDAVFREIVEAFALEPGPKFDQAINRASSTSGITAPDKSPVAPLDEHDREKIRAIVGRFGADIYDRGEPMLDRLDERWGIVPVGH